MLPQNLHRIAFGQQLVRDALAKFSIQRRKLLIDFSSPNIAKTFHLGNLRSTLYGNFMQKICRLAGHDVVSINYLGDWGQQFSILAFYWMAVMDGQEGRAKRPEADEWAAMNARERVTLLTSAYSAAYKMAKLNPAFKERVHKLFLEMERTKLQKNFAASEETAQALHLWQEWVRTSREYLEDFYGRFGVHFDEWDGESAYVEEGSRLVDTMIAEGNCRLVENEEGNTAWTVEKPEFGRQPKIALRRGDGANIYLNRELASIYARHKRHNADQYIFVVDREQHNHFAHLKHLLRLQGDEELAERIVHFPYGRIIGLSTREGKNDSVDFLIKQGQREAQAYVDGSFTKRSTQSERAHLCRSLAQSQLVFDLVRRNKDSNYTFSYRSAFKPEDTNALVLHEKYSRLNSLELANHEHMDRLRALDQNELVRMRPEMAEVAQKLAGMISEFDTVLNNALVRMEPCPVTMYLSRLSNSIGKAMPTLRVLGEPRSVALPRMLLFSAAKKVLGEGMLLVGIDPIERI